MTARPRRALPSLVAPAALLAAALLPFAGCRPGGADDAADRPVRVAVVPKGTTHVFWRTIEAGARAAAAEGAPDGRRVEIVWKGPLQEDDRTSQVAVIEGFTGQGIDGIVLAPLDSRALVPPVRQAVAAGIPVVVIDSALEDSSPVSFAATDNRRGGELAGEELARALGGRGRVLMLRYQVGSASTEEREAGFLEAIRRHPGIEIVSENQHAGATRDSARTAAENLLTRFGGVVDGIFTPNESSTNGMLLALRAIGRAGQVRFVGFDGGEQNVGALRAGEIDALVLQDPFRMGYLGVRLLLDHRAGRPVEARVDTGARLVTRANLADPAIAALIEPPLAAAP